MVPLIGSYVHFEGLNRSSSIHEVLLCEIVLSNLGVVLSNLLIIRTSDLRRLVSNELDCTVPLSGGKCSFDGFVEDSSLDVVLNRKINLLLTCKPITPLFFKIDDV